MKNSHLLIILGAFTALVFRRIWPMSWFWKFVIIAGVFAGMIWAQIKADSSKPL
jgi:hypothetical protein